MTVRLKAFGDESADATKTRVFAVAAVIGSEDERVVATREWLRRTRGRPFHANRCEFEYVRDPDAQKHKDNLKLYEDLTKILAASHLVGIAVAVDLQSMSDCLPGTLSDIPYYKCFTDVVSHSARMARRLNENPKAVEDLRLEFVFDSRRESNGTAGVIYRTFRARPEWKDFGILDAEVVFEAGSILPRLEVADLLARESMKELDRRITGARRSARASFKALDDAFVGETKKFVWIHYDRPYCERWRELVESSESREMIRRYSEWLVATKRVQNGRPHDNPANRVLFYSWLEQEAFSQRGNREAGAVPVGLQRDPTPRIARDNRLSE